MTVSEALLNLLSCPKCSGKLHDEGNRVTCRICRLRFGVDGGAPILHLEYAEKF